MRTYSVKLAISAVLALSVPGCTAPYSSPQIHSFEKSPVTIHGISDLLNDHTMQLNADHPEVDLIAIHGMCTHDGEWALESINALAKQLGEPPVPSKENLTRLTVEDSNAIVYKRQLSVAAGVVNIAAVVWSPVLTPLKQQLCYDQKTKTGLCARGEKEKPDFLSKALDSPDFEETRALGNRLGKDTLLDDCLVDAVAYQGRAREEISRQIQKAIIAAAVPGNDERPTASLLLEAAGRSAPLIMFTSSLGSKVGFDAIESLSNSSQKEKVAAKAIMERLKTVFMSANQIPLLQLADQTLSEASSVNLTQTTQSPSDALSRLLDNPSLVPGSKPTIVFLSDPNDILSYSLRNAPLRPQYASIDVVVSNDWTWFGLFENPKTAHTGYLDQPEITKIVVNGIHPSK